MSYSVAIRFEVCCEKCYDSETDSSPIVMKRGEVGDFYRCYRCDNRVTIMTTIDPGEESET
jgi:hypothetical protein